MLLVEGNVHKNLKHLQTVRHIDGNQAAVSVMHHKITAQCACREIVNTTRTVRDVTHNHCLTIGKPVKSTQLMTSCA